MPELLDWIADKWDNAWTGMLTPDQKSDAIDQCAADNFRAGGGRITFEQARAQCAAPMQQVMAMNDQDAMAANHSRMSLALLLAAGVTVTGIVIVSGRK